MSCRDLTACAVVSVLVAGCDAGAIHAVGGPSGVYRPNQSCTLVESAPRCPQPGEPTPALRFESLVNPGVVADAQSVTLSDVAVTCRRSYCGTGSLAARAELDWTADPEDPGRFATFVYEFDTSRDLVGKTVSFAVFAEGPTIPMHAQIGVIFGFWRWVAWSPLSAGWNHIAGVVSPANPLTKIDPSVTSIPVTSLQIDVYVPTGTVVGNNGSWSGNLYLDEIGWE